MAPEVYRGDAYGFGADIYSLGVVLYRFLNRSRTPFLPAYPDPIRYMDREQAVNRRVAGEAIPEPCLGSARLKAAVLRACAYEPSERFASAQAFREELEAIRSGVTVRVEPAAGETVEAKAEPAASEIAEMESRPEAEKKEADTRAKEKPEKARKQNKKPKRKREAKEKEPKGDKLKKIQEPEAQMQTAWWKRRTVGWLLPAAAFVLGYLVFVEHIERLGTFSGLVFLQFGSPLETDYIGLHIHPQGILWECVGIVLILAQVYWLPCLIGGAVLSVCGRLWSGIWKERSAKRIAGLAALLLLVFLSAGKITQALLIAFYLIEGSDWTAKLVILLPTAGVFFGGWKLWQRRRRKRAERVKEEQPGERTDGVG